MQDFALPRQQIVFDGQSLHRAQVAARDGHRDNLRQLRRHAIPLFDGRERLPAQRKPRRVLLEKLCDASVQIPAQVVEARRLRQGPHLGRRLLFHILECNDHVRHLHAGVINIILHFHAPPGATEQAHQRVAERGIAQVTDVRRLVRIDVGVLDD